MLRRLVIMLILSAFLFSCASYKKVDYYKELSDDYFDEEPITVAEHSQEENINGLLPDKIYIKTPTQTFNKYYQFAINDGKVYYKGLTPDAEPYCWVPLKETGIPEHSFHRFPTPEKVTEIAADLDSIIAMDDNGLAYEYYCVRSTVRQHRIWLATMGFPKKKQLAVNPLTRNKRSWATATRREEILWYEDAFGNQHHYGSMGIETFYFLTEDGRSIRFTDSGLPADMSRSIMLPERGRFIASRLCASGSTVMLINAAGEIYTRLIDFDTMGCDPMFYLYTYENEKQPYPGWKYKSNFTEWGLPAEEWTKQPEIQLDGQARITDHITIIQDGQGNFARELRVAGLSAAGRPGYYFKNILDETWQFQEAPLQIPEDRFLNTAQDRDVLRGEPTEFQYAGKLELPDREPVYMHIPNFSMSEGECTLELKYGSEQASVTVYPVEVWCYLFRYDPGFDGVPKAFFVTFSTEELEKQELSADFREILENIFICKDLETFSSRAEATEDYLHMVIPDTELGDVEFTLIKETADGTEPDRDYTLWYNQMMLDNTALGAHNIQELAVSPENELAAAIQANRDYLELVKAEYKKYKSYNSYSKNSKMLYSIFDVFSKVTFIEHLNYPKIRTLKVHGKKIFRANYYQYHGMLEKKKASYRHLMDILEERISCYEDMLEKCREDSHAELLDDPGNNFEKYLRLLQIPEEISGESAVYGGNAKAEICRDIPFFPGYVITGGEIENPVLVEIKRPMKDITEAAESKEPLPVRLPVRIRTYSMKKVDRESGYLIWDGNTMSIHASREKIIFRGSISPDQL